MTRKGVIVAGGTGSRLFPITQGVSKQLLPVYDKPMIYYPLSVLMLAGIREIAVVVNPHERASFDRLLGSGEGWGLKFTYVEQPQPRGIAQALILAEEFLAGAPSAVILGDNLFYGGGLTFALRRAAGRFEGATVFAHPVQNPSEFGVLTLDAQERPTSIIEKPPRPPSNLAVTGLYFYDERASSLARRLKPSARGELEITDLNRLYLDEGSLHVEQLGRGVAWLDTGTPAGLLRAGQFIETIQERQGLMVASPEEIAFRYGFIDRDGLLSAAASLAKSPYGEYLQQIARSA